MAKINKYETNFRRLRTAGEFDGPNGVCRIVDRVYCPVCREVIIIAISCGDKVSFAGLHRKCTEGR